MPSNGLPFVVIFGPTTSGRLLNPMPTTAKGYAITPSGASNLTSGMATNVRPKQARSGRSNSPAVKRFPLQRLSGCTPTFHEQKPTTTTLILPAIADTLVTCFGAAKRLLAGQEINSENLANSTKADTEAKIQARMDSLMMVITTLCDCIGAVDESNSPNAFAVKMKIVDKIDELIDKIEY